MKRLPSTTSIFNYAPNGWRSGRVGTNAEEEKEEEGGAVDAAVRDGSLAAALISTSHTRSASRGQARWHRDCAARTPTRFIRVWKC